MFPWGFVAGHMAAPLSRRIGLPVTIAGAHRVGNFSLAPEIVLTGVRVGQPTWAGPGALVAIGEARVRFPALPMLLGHFRPYSIDLARLRINLLRDAGGRPSWQAARWSDRPGRGPRIAHLRISDGTVRFVDRKSRITLAGTVTVDPQVGLRIEARGLHRGTPLTVTVQGGKLDAADPRAPWPLTIHAASTLVRLDAAARLAHPLDLGHLDAHLTAGGHDLSDLDGLIEAGLFHTQPFDLAATVRHDAPDWRVEGLAGRVGRSRLAANLIVRKRGGRTLLDGTVDAATLDFDDFASDAQLARGRARQARDGKRIIPDTRIRLDNLQQLDGSVRLTAGRLIGAPPFTSLETIVSLDHGRLALDPLTATMAPGRVIGALSVTQRGPPPPVAALDLRLRGATIQTLILPKHEVDGPLAARIVLSGPGSTFREAMAHASGRTGVIVPAGSIRRDYATYLGGNVLKSVGALISGGSAARAPLHCLVGNFHATDGTLVPTTLVLDNAISRGDGRGRMTLGDERIDLVFTGRPKQPGPLLSTTPTRLFGSFIAPIVDIRPPRAERERKSGLFGRLGALVKGLRTRGDMGRSAAAPDADCAALERRALR